VRAMLPMVAITAVFPGGGCNDCCLPRWIYTERCCECGAQIRFVNQAEADKRTGMTWELSCSRMGLHPNTVREWRAMRPALEATLAAARKNKNLGAVNALRQHSSRGARYPDMEEHVNGAIMKRRESGFKVSAVGVAAGAPAVSARVAGG
jgi:hypothetical protein